MQAVIDEKILDSPEWENGISFNKTEWKNFLLEINDMMTSDRKLDIQKAIRNARYLAIIDKGIEQMNNGGGRALSDEELRGMIYAGDFS